ncbi:ACP S-malonyltransferase [Paenibacillus sp. S150]|uniref:ACP S-malonyltransferase n=1 Tax=Paenibacillus sp. S150 TaxID=2749826 RepID=UPI001C5A4584|nr:ACP S-malonyltransferase [Paenibacillus sp. S150]MBW4085272.1 ACP S-malonyltransferase [Paenibacillus sp. S150]
MRAYVFPGQGSQVKGMGASLFDRYHELTAQADEILGYSLQDLCLEDRHQCLNQTQYTQPALYAVSVLSYMQQVEEAGKEPDVLAGHSLGEYTALYAGGAFDFGTGLKLVQQRGQLMSKIEGGAMAAVIGLTGDQVMRVLHDSRLSSIDIANYNAPRQIVITGPKQDIEKAGRFFEAAGASMYVVLKVSGAFHSRYMKECQTQFARYLDHFTFNSLRIPVLANLTGMPYAQDEVKSNLVGQLAAPVCWTDSIRYLLAHEAQIEEIGPGNVLTRLVQNIASEAEPLDLRGKITLTDTIDWLARNDESKEKQQTDDLGDRKIKLSAVTLGCEQFRQDYRVQYAYVTGAMYKGIASKELVVRMGKAGMLSFFGSGGLSLQEIEAAIGYIQRELVKGQPYGMNLLHHPDKPQVEEHLVELYLKHGIQNVEAAAYMGITPALVRYRAHGLRTRADGTIETTHRIMAKLSRPEVAEAFLSPAEGKLIQRLTEEGLITSEQAKLLPLVPMADDICVECDSGGHTDMGVAYVLVPVIMKLRDELQRKYNYSKRIRVGTAGGIGTPEAAAAAFVMGADFIVTGSINQCTVEAGTSDSVKYMLNQMNVQDTDYAPAGDMFELGAKVQVLKKGVFFPVRANKLYDMYKFFASIDDIDAALRQQLEEKYFKRNLDQVYEDVKKYYSPAEIEKAERNPKHKMTVVFKSYFANSTRAALMGDEQQKVNYQIHCGPALGAFNQWMKGTPWERWTNRHVDEIGKHLMEETSKLLKERLSKWGF